MDDPWSLDSRGIQTFYRFILLISLEFDHKTHRAKDSFPDFVNSSFPLIMSEAEGKSNSSEIPENAQDLTIFVQNLLEQMVLFLLNIYEAFKPVTFIIC